jgi:predicted aspartyl protease
VRDWRVMVMSTVVLALGGHAARAAVPLSWDSTGHIVVPAMVNGFGPFEFILDTGADESAVYSWFAKSLNLPAGRAGELSGATGTQPMLATRVSSLAVDGHTISNVQADTIPDRVDGAKLAGVAGVDLMRHRLAVIDIGCGTFALEPLPGSSSSIRRTGGTAIRAGSIRDGKQLTLPVSINGATGVALLDTGARYTMINHRFAAAAGIAPQSGAFRDAEPARGATSTAVPVRVGPIGNVRFGAIARPDATARIVDLPYLEGAGLAGKPVMNLGLDFLRGVRLTVDFSARQVWLASSSCPSAEPMAQ